MSYHTQAQLSEDLAIRQRVAAAAAKEGLVAPHPFTWATERMWEIAAEPGWDDAYSYALAAGNPEPTVDPAVISDGMILSAVQTVRARETAREEVATEAGVSIQRPGRPTWRAA